MANPERCIALFKGEKAVVEIWMQFEDAEYKLLAIDEKGNKKQTKFAYLKSTAYSMAAKMLTELEIKNGVEKND